VWYSIAVSDKPPTIGGLIRSLLSGIRELITVIQKQVKSITPEAGPTQKATNKQDSIPPFMRADVHIVEGIEVRKNAKEATDDRAYKSKTLRVSWLSFWVGLATLISLIVYACITHGQLVEMRKATIAATKSANTAEKMMVLDERAWVGVPSINGSKPEV
jgi:hypothetical protein